MRGNRERKREEGNREIGKEKKGGLKSNMYIF